ncbi:MAG TPA: BMP family ABC transporter substrate-binding protein, partial [Caldisericia bacterium]|nr:BMP family ABC transporter substrate-binding protein [Caldisericia bacterium]
EQTLTIKFEGYADFSEKLSVEGGKTVTKDVTLSPVIKIGLVTDVGGRGDKSFNDSALRGLEAWGAGLKMVAGVGYQELTDEEYEKSIADEAPDLADRGIKKFDIQPLVLESKVNEDYVPNLKRLADEGAKLVIGVGFMLTDAISEVAPQYPNTYFMLIDGVIDPAPPNVVCYSFKEHEGSYLVGALVGQMTKKNIVGFVGGMENFLIQKFEVGYRAGVQTVNPKAKVLYAYTGNFTNADDGQKIAKQQFDAGADIVYHASGACGIGVIKEAQARGEGYFAVGVDSDQDYMAPGRVLTSMIKHVDYAVWLSIKSVVEGTFQSGVVSLGIKEGGVGISPLKYTRDIIPDEVLNKVNTLKNMIAEGTLVIPDSREALNKFVPPTLP